MTKQSTKAPGPLAVYSLKVKHVSSYMNSLMSCASPYGAMLVMTRKIKWMRHWKRPRCIDSPRWTTTLVTREPWRFSFIHLFRLYHNWVKLLDTTCNYWRCVRITRTSTGDWLFFYGQLTYCAKVPSTPGPDTTSVVATKVSINLTQLLWLWYNTVNKRADTHIHSRAAW